ncbi:MAG: 30S ribosomal protein S6 [Candidatus Solibacter sp.]|nr:30S ribosomal protein S6 [Candidatus Solibacter sp.]
MRVYEELFIVRPDATEEDIDAYVEQVSSTITAAGGTVEKVEKWGVRRLAYRVGKRSEGFYVLIVFNAGADVAKEVERRMRVTDMVMKFITVRVDERMKKIDKRRKAREKRAKRRPSPTPLPAAPAMPAMPAPGAPAAMPGVPAAPVPAEPEAAAPVAETGSES